jgi:hypothetical protein
MGVPHNFPIRVVTYSQAVFTKDQLVKRNRTEEEKRKILERMLKALIVKPVDNEEDDD